MKPQKITRTLLFGIVIINPSKSVTAPPLIAPSCYPACATLSNCPSWTYSNCNNIDCESCQTNPLTQTNSGVSTTTYKAYETQCNANNCTASCSCETSKVVYECATGYYGTATSTSTGCTACPANATCAGGNGSTFVCNKNYYKNNTMCTPCPDYPDKVTSSTLTRSGVTNAAGATSVSECYIPSSNITTYTNSTGTYQLTANCPY